MRKALPMIRLIDRREVPRLLSFCEGSPYGVRLAAFLQAYGPGYPFALFWVQTDDSGRMTAALSRVDGQVTVCACEQADLEELWAFLSAVGYESVLCPAWVAQASSTRGVCRMESCHAMRLSRAPAVPAIQEPATICKEPSLRQVYILLQAAGEPLPQWEAWLPDVSHRVRHGAARVWALREEDGYSACAMAVAQTGREALLGGVAVLPDKRCKGRGSYLAAALCSALAREGKAGKAVYLFRRAGMHEQFYERMGFAPYGPPAMMIQKGV